MSIIKLLSVVAAILVGFLINTEKTIFVYYFYCLTYFYLGLTQTLSHNGSHFKYPFNTKKEEEKKQNITPIS